jgi:hypothetical protein
VQMCGSPLIWHEFLCASQARNPLAGTCLYTGSYLPMETRYRDCSWLVGTKPTKLSLLSPLSLCPHESPSWLHTLCPPSSVDIFPRFQGWKDPWGWMSKRLSGSATTNNTSLSNSYDSVTPCSMWANHLESYPVESHSHPLHSCRPPVESYIFVDYNTLEFSIKAQEESQ